ncbi:MAG: J domain-containing protein [Desulfovibrionales bacterium]
MYLAQTIKDGTIHYAIRESFRDASGWHSRTLLRLGTDPARHIEYPGGRTFYINEEIEDALNDMDVHPSTEDVEELFWPFLRPDVQHAQDHFRGRSKTRSRRRIKLNHEEEQRLDAQIHEFDRRRLFYLKTGNLDLSRIRTMPMKYFRSLADKSRDEIEHRFALEERALSEREFKRYVYASLNLQQFFANLDARHYPQFLDERTMDEAFTETICALNRDPRFWREPPPAGGLHDHLIRYAVMYYDFGFGGDTFLQDRINQFIGSRRAYRPPTPRPGVSEQDTSTLFGRSKTELMRMDKRDLARLYKKRAMEYHPDRGGDSEKFIRLTEVYKAVVHSRRVMQG